MARHRLKWFLFSIIPCVVLLALAETILSFAFPAFDFVVVMGVREQTMHVWSDPSVWCRVEDRRRIVLAPNPDKGVNAEGYRGPAVPIQRNGATFRILSLGDSTTYGVGVMEDETYSAQLERILIEHGSRAEVINAGVPSYTSEQGLEALQRRWNHYHPDLILTYFGNNDSSLVMSRPDKELMVLPSSLSLSRTLLERSRIYMLMQAVYLQTLNRSQKVPRVYEEDFKINLLRIEEIGYSMGAQVLHVQPVVSSKTELFEGGYSVDLEQLHLSEVFTDSGHGVDKLFLDGVHPSAEGHRIIAAFLFKVLETSTFLDDGTKVDDLKDGPAL